MRVEAVDKVSRKTPDESEILTLKMIRAKFLARIYTRPVQFQSLSGGVRIPPNVELGLSATRY